MAWDILRIGRPKHLGGTDYYRHVTAVQCPKCRELEVTVYDDFSGEYRCMACDRNIGTPKETVITVWNEFTNHTNSQQGTGRRPGCRWCRTGTYGMCADGITYLSRIREHEVRYEVPYLAILGTGPDSMIEVRALWHAQERDITRVMHPHAVLVDQPHIFQVLW